VGENHKENLLSCLRQWHAITLKQREVLAAGNIDEFERFNRVAVVLQGRFDNSLSKLKQPRVAQEDMKLLEEIKELQAQFIEEFKKGTQELAKTIDTLRKNKNSMNGYRRNTPAKPRFKSERT
jgi:hypothetical protein